MKRAIFATLMVIRVTGLIQIVLGVLFWTGLATNLVPVHMAIGYLFVLALWTLAALSLAAGAPAVLVALAFGWGLVVPALGIAQVGLLVGSWHWVIRALHLAVGLAAMGIAQTLAERAGVLTRRGRGPVSVEAVVRTEGHIS